MDDIDFSVITKAATARPFAPGEVIFEAGAEGSEFYLVKSGTVDIKKGDRVLETVEANGTFGEMALIDGGPRSASAVGKTAGEVVALNERQFIFLIGETPYFALNIMRVMARRLRHMTAAQA